MLTALTNATIYTGTEVLTGKAVLINDNRIAGIVDNEAVPESAEKADCQGKYVAPGLIDLQIAGGGGYLFSANPSATALTAIADSIARTGTTGFLMAIPTDSSDVYRDVCGVVKANPHPALLGLHLEGPFISQARRGAHTSSLIKLPGKEEVISLLEEAGGVIRLITVAPEVCTTDIIRIFREYNVVVSAGHSNATFEQAASGFNSGIQATTHLFNAMSQLHHRDPGLPGATFETDNVMASIIADGIHVHYKTISIAKKLMKERLFLISDAVEESFQGTQLHVRRKDRFTLPDGTLSGSLLTMLRAVKNCVEHTGIELEEALRMASLYPARLLNLADRGIIAEGFKADLIVFDRELEIKSVYLNGKLIS